MLPKSQRLTTEQVSAVIKNGKPFHSPFFTLRVVLGQDKGGFAAIMSKKIAKTAVSRNLARRRVYEALKANGIGSPNTPETGAQTIILCKDSVTGASLEALTNDLKTLLKKAHVL